MITVALLPEMGTEGVRVVKSESEASEKPFLNTKEAAAWLGLTKNTLEKMRVFGTGPLYRKHGRYVRYHLEDLTAYSEASKRRSTSDER